MEDPELEEVIKEHYEFKYLDYRDLNQWNPLVNRSDAVQEEEQMRLGIEWDIYGPAGRYGEW